MAAPDVGTIASLATALTLVAALVFGILQARHARDQRRRNALGELIHNMRAPEVVGPIRAVMNLPAATEPMRIADDSELRRVVDGAVVVFESMGFMAHARLVDLHALDYAAGGVVRGSWRRLKPYVEWVRGQTDDANFGEWFQWLAERMEEDPAPGKEQGAHVAFRGWRR